MRSELASPWRRVPLGDVFEMQLGKMLSKAAKRGTSPAFYLGNRHVQWDRVDLSNLEWMDFTRAEREKFNLLPGDLLVCEGGEVGRTALWRGERRDVFFQKAIHRLRVRSGAEVEPAYVLRWMRLAAQTGRFTDFTSQTSISHLTQEQLARVELEMPPFPEQRRIAEILDAADAAINGTESVIAKAKLELRGLLLALMDRGDMRREPLSVALARIEAGRSPDLPDRPAPPGDWGVLKVSSIGDGEFYPEENKHVTTASLRRPEYEVREGDVLLSRANTSDLVGLVCYVEWTPPHIMLCDKTLRLAVNSERAIAPYLALALSSPGARRQISLHATGTSGSMKNISQAALLGVRVPLPTLDEQRRVVTVLDAARARIRSEESHVGKLRLQKQGLMQDLLTGRVRVNA